GWSTWGVPMVQNQGDGLRFIAPAAGDYQVRVASSTSGGTQTHAYSISVQIDSPAALGSDTEPNGDAGSAGTVFALPGDGTGLHDHAPLVVEGSLDAGGDPLTSDVDEYRFDVAPGESLLVSAVTGPSSADVSLRKADTFVVILDGNGNEVA